MRLTMAMGAPASSSGLLADLDAIATRVAQIETAKPGARLLIGDDRKPAAPQLALDRVQIRHIIGDVAARVCIGGNLDSFERNMELYRTQAIPHPAIAGEFRGLWDFAEA
ncbi:MAG TPA: hypothetical protein VN668_01670 [Stellaceae bacterium]|nr:hypothetical protein [Stellaceae bacterium]